MLDDQGNRSGRTPWLRPWLTLAALLTLLLSSSAAHAGDGIGTVWTSDVTDTSFVVHWDFKAQDYIGPFGFEVCIKHPGSLATSCWWQSFGWSHQEQVAPGTERSKLITGMEAGKKYKIKVQAHHIQRRRKTAFGRFFSWVSNAVTDDWTKVGVAEVSTADPNPSELAASFWVSGVDPHHITASWKWYGPGAPTANLHLCLKVRWSIKDLGDCKSNSPGVPASGAGTITIPDRTRTSLQLGPETQNGSINIEKSKNYVLYLVDGSKVYGSAKVTTPDVP